MKHPIAIGIAVALANFLLVWIFVVLGLHTVFSESGHMMAIGRVAGAAAYVFSLPLTLPVFHLRLRMPIALQFLLMVLNSVIWGAVAFWLLRRRARTRSGSNSPRLHS